jgi:hypothetical protein
MGLTRIFRNDQNFHYDNAKSSIYMCLWFLDRKKQRRRSQAGQGKSDSRQQSASTDSRQQSAKFENETGDEVIKCTFWKTGKWGTQESNGGITMTVCFQNLLTTLQLWQLLLKIFFGPSYFPTLIRVVQNYFLKPYVKCSLVKVNQTADNSQLLQTVVNSQLNLRMRQEMKLQLHPKVSQTVENRAQIGFIKVFKT